jgi:hypothetical protein
MRLRAGGVRVEVYDNNTLILLRLKKKLEDIIIFTILLFRDMQIKTYFGIINT